MDVNTLVSLERLRPGEWADVAEVFGEPGWADRLAELGLFTGCRLRVLQAGWPCLLQIGGGRLSIRGAAGTRILVRRVTPCDPLARPPVHGTAFAST
jgi:Fe2+ transport system protein FeoA